MVCQGVRERIFKGWWTSKEEEVTSKHLRDSGQSKKAEQIQAASRYRANPELSQKEETCLTAKMVPFSSQDDYDFATERLLFG